LVFGWAAAAAILLSLIATVGKLWTGAIIDGQKAKEIADLKSTVRVLQPRSIGTSEGGALIEALSKYEQMTVGFAAKIFDPEAKQFS
jgi:hypothetical protein